MKTIKKHHGIIILAKKSTEDNIVRYLLVKKLYTYPFILLLLGKYTYNYRYNLCINIKINMITPYELYLLKTYKLKDIYKIYLGQPHNTDFFTLLIKKFRNYKKIFKQRYKRSIIDHLVDIVKYNTTQWTAPGGICNNNENIYTCIERELYEETGISMSDVKNYTKLDYNLNVKNYKNKSKHKIIDYNYYYCGIYNGKKKSSIYRSFDTEYVYWYTLNEIKFIQIDNYIKKIIEIWHHKLKIKDF